MGIRTACQGRRLRLKLDHEDSISPTLEWHALKTWHIQLPCGPQIVKTKMDATWSDAASVLQLDLSQFLVLNQDDASPAPRSIGPAFAPCLGEVHIHCLPCVRINPNVDHAFFGDSANLIAKKVLAMSHATTDATLMYTSIRAEVRGTSCEIMQFALPSTVVLSEVTACALDVFASQVGKHWRAETQQLHETITCPMLQRLSHVNAINQRQIVLRCDRQHPDLDGSLPDCIRLTCVHNGNRSGWVLHQPDTAKIQHLISSFASTPLRQLKLWRSNGKPFDTLHPNDDMLTLHTARPQMGITAKSHQGIATDPFRVALDQAKAVFANASFPMASDTFQASLKRLWSKTSEALGQSKKSKSEALRPYAVFLSPGCVVDVWAHDSFTVLQVLQQAKAQTGTDIQGLTNDEGRELPLGSLIAHAGSRLLHAILPHGLTHYAFGGTPLDFSVNRPLSDARQVQLWVVPPESHRHCEMHGDASMQALAFLNEAYPQVHSAAWWCNGRARTF